MHQAHWSPERPLPPAVSLASQSHHVTANLAPKSLKGIQQKKPRMASTIYLNVINKSVSEHCTES